MAKLLHIFYHKEGTFSLLCQQVQLITVSGKLLPVLINIKYVRFKINQQCGISYLQHSEVHVRLLLREQGPQHEHRICLRCRYQAR